jgi:hypothetical protein
LIEFYSRATNNEKGVSIKYKAEFFFEKKQTKDMKRERGKENIEPEIRISLIQLPHHLGKSLKKGVNTSV